MSYRKIILYGKKIESKGYIISHSQELSRGTAESDVDLVELKIGKRRIDLVRKTPTEGDEALNLRDRAKRQFDVHSILKEKGYPVPPTWRFDKTTGQTFITDLTEKGRNLVIDLNNLTEERNKIVVSNMGELIRDMRYIVEKASKDGILIASDCYFIIVDKKTGNSRVILGDLGNIDLHARDIDKLLMCNTVIMNEAIRMLKDAVYNSAKNSSRFED